MIKAQLEKLALRVRKAQQEQQAHRPQGNAGADALTLTITSSAGIIFKNNTGSTVLTAHVFKGSAEQTISSTGVVSGIGTVKWYAGGVYQKSSNTYAVGAGDVPNSLAITCQLEA